MIRYLCRKHPSREAVGKCARCGRRVCSDCAVQYKGDVYCRDWCFPAVKDKTWDKSGRDEVKNGKARMGYRVMILAVFTLSISLAAIMLVMYRENNDLKKRVSELAEDRKRAVELIKIKNRKLSQAGLTDPVGYSDMEGNTLSLPVEDSSDSSNGAAVREVVQLEQEIHKGNGVPSSGNYDICNGPVEKMCVYLTFDGAYYNNVTGDILDTLRSRGVKATMFLTGAYIRKYPETVKRIVQEGHVVGNHTYSHPHLTSYEEDRRHTTKPGIGPERIRRELYMNDSLFKATVGHGMKSIWRAPYGERNREICRWAKECGYIHIGWKRARSPRYNYDTYDWVPDRETPGYFTPMEILEKFERLSESSQNGMNGAIILMHLGSTREREEEMVHTILGRFIDMMRDKGYSFSVVTDMIPEGA